MKTALLSMALLSYGTLMQAMDLTLSPFIRTSQASPQLNGGAGSEMNSAVSSGSGISKKSKIPSLQLNASSKAFSLEEGTAGVVDEKAEQKKSAISESLELVLAGENYYYGNSGKQQDYLVAYALFDRALQRSDDQRAVAWGNFYKGTMLAMGHGVSHDFDGANNSLKAAARQKVDGLVVSKAALALGRLYDNTGTTENARDHKLLSSAHSCFLYVIANPPDDDGLAEAHFMVGMQYEHGDGASQSNHDALTHYQKSAAVSQSFGYSSAARLCMCDFAYSGKVIPKNNKYALSLCEQVIKHTQDPLYRIKAKLRRGVLYVEGDYGIKPNIDLARKDLTEVIQQVDDLDAAKKAKTWLAYLDAQGMQSKEKKE